MKRGMLVLAAAALASGCDSKPAGPTLTIWWAAWEPSVGLEKLGNEWGRDNHVTVKVVKFPWSDFLTKWQLEEAKSRTDFDIVVGDSQWVGLGATKGWYLELTDLLKPEIATLHPKAAAYLSEYPTGSGRYYSAPCETDAMGLAYRKDWFEDPKEREAFKARYKRDLKAPETWEELKDIAEFFTRPGGENPRFGWSVLTGRGYDALTMGFEENLWAWGADWFKIEEGKKVRIKSVVNSAEAVSALQFFIDLLKFGPKGASMLDYVQCMEVLTNGSTAMCANYFAFFPFIHKQMGDKVGFAMIPRKGDKRVISLGGQGLSVSTKVSPAQQEMAKKFITWFLRTETQRKWVAHPGCFTGNVEVLKSEEFRKGSPWNAVFADSLDDLKDFTNEPFFGDLLQPAQKHLGEALDGGKTPQAALDAIASDFADVFRRNGWTVIE